jgi:hypothetical protein
MANFFAALVNLFYAIGLMTWKPNFPIISKVRNSFSASETDMNNRTLLLPMNPHTGCSLLLHWEAKTQPSYLRQNFNEENLDGEPASPSIPFKYTKGAFHAISARSNGEKPYTETMNVTRRKTSNLFNKKVLPITLQTPRLMNNKKLYSNQGTYSLLDPTKPDTGTSGPMPIITGKAKSDISGKNLDGETQRPLNTFNQCKGPSQIILSNSKGGKRPHKTSKIKFSMTLTGIQIPPRPTPTPWLQNTYFFMDSRAQSPKQKRVSITTHGQACTLNEMDSKTEPPEVEHILNGMNNPGNQQSELHCNQETISYVVMKERNQAEENKTAHSRNANAKLPHEMENIHHMAHWTTLKSAWDSMQTRSVNTPRLRGQHTHCPQAGNNDPNTSAHSTSYADVRSRHNVHTTVTTRLSQRLVLKIRCTTVQDSHQQCKAKAIKLTMSHSTRNSRDHRHAQQFQSGNLLIHKSKLFQVKEMKILSNTMAQITRQIQDTSGCHKTAAQKAQHSSNHCDRVEHLRQTLNNLSNNHIHQQNPIHKNTEAKPQGANSAHTKSDISERNSSKSSATPVTETTSAKKETINKNKIHSYHVTRNSPRRHSSTGSCSRSIQFDQRILHDAITGRVRLGENNETSNFTYQSNGIYPRPTIHKRRHPVNNNITTGEMADEGTPSKKPRHEEIAQSSA